MPEKPSYLEMLNTIALGERGGGEFLSAWAETTSDPALCQVLKTVAIREAEHGLAFEKRICELGFALEERVDPELEGRIRCARSGLSDLEKFDALGLTKLLEDSGDDSPDPFLEIFKDQTIDIQTGALLGRFIAEERDSGRMLKACCEALNRQAKGNGATVGGDVSLADVCAALESLTSMVRDLQSDVANLKTVPARA